MIELLLIDVSQVHKVLSLDVELPHQDHLVDHQLPKNVGTLVGLNIVDETIFIACQVKLRPVLLLLHCPLKVQQRVLLDGKQPEAFLLGGKVGEVKCQCADDVAHSECNRDYLC